jgi:hypothetical protein
MAPFCAPRRHALSWGKARFEIVARIWHLQLASGQVIRTTAKHPFSVEGRAWDTRGPLATNLPAREPQLSAGGSPRNLRH